MLKCIRLLGGYVPAENRRLKSLLQEERNMTLQKSEALAAARRWMKAQTDLPPESEILNRYYDVDLCGRRYSVQLYVRFEGTNAPQKTFGLVDICVLDDETVLILKDRRARVADLLHYAKYTPCKKVRHYNQSSRVVSHSDGLNRFLSIVEEQGDDTPDWLLSLDMAEGEIAKNGYDAWALVSYVRGEFVVPIKITTTKAAKSDFCTKRPTKEIQAAVVLIVRSDLTQVDIRTRFYHALSEVRRLKPQR